MPAERTLPIDAAHREFTLKVDGQVLPREHALVALSIVAAPNRIASAQLSFADGSAADGDFPLSTDGPLQPGARVQVLAGAARSQVLVFDGIVTGQRLRAREAAPPLLQVDCRHAATRLARTRRSANFFDQTDAEVIQSLLQQGGLTAEVGHSRVRHEQLVQHDCSDWDFIVARAAANALVVHTRAHRLAVQPVTLGEPAAELRYGATVLEFDAELDARRASPAVQARSWVAADQAVQVSDGAASTLALPDQLDPAALAQDMGHADRLLDHAALPQGEAAALASAARAAEAADLINARVKCVGIASVLPGDTVDIQGVGRRFSGKYFVAGVRHEYDSSQGWKTHLQCGHVEPEPALRQRLAAHRTAQLLAPAAGLAIGVVVDNEDPQGEYRVRVRLPLVNDADDGVWARVAALDAGPDRGSVFRPELGDEVVVGYLDDDPRQPVLLGMLHSSAHAAPLTPANANDHKGFTTRSGIVLQFDDATKSLTLKTPAGNQLVLDDDAGGITLQDANGNKLEMRASGITLESAAALTLKIGSSAKVEAAANLEVKAGAVLKLQGVATTDIKSGGVVKVAGSAIQLG
jgi:Rhs element Vgr protein